jgi:hypothetical protein
MTDTTTIIATGPLSRRDRTWIALYSLDSRHYNHRYSRAQVLAVNNITEKDLVEFEDSWLKMRCQMLA